MRVLIIGSANPWRMERGTERALRRAGHKTRLIDDKRARRFFGPRLSQRWVLSRARRFDADFVILSKCHGLLADTVAEIIEGKDNAMWYHDAQWYRSTYRPDIAHIIKIGKLTRTFFVSGFEKEWAALGLPAKFLPSCADARIRPVPVSKQFASDVAFIGTGYDPSRANFLMKVASKFDLRVWGNGWDEWRQRLKWSGRPIEGKEFAAVCSSSKIVLGVNPARYTADSGNTTSDRTWMTILAGGFFLGHGTPELKKMLREGDHCGWYTDVDSCMEQIAYYLQKPEQRERIRREGQAFVREYHTFDQRIHNLLSGEAFVNPLA
ncbi:MAG TPA: glycosyltransferase [Gemmatimonadaceae bacterium]|nr:glycosyltransferase [Gemmatimonadaceae bacterium]